MSIVDKASICCNCFVYMFRNFHSANAIVIDFHKPEVIFDEFGGLDPIASLQNL